MQTINSPLSSEAVNLIPKITHAKRVVVLTGAGISRASGIPVRGWSLPYTTRLWRKPQGHSRYQLLEKPNWIEAAICSSSLDVVTSDKRNTYHSTPIDSPPMQA
ncbi:unnamed protein product [Rhizoctonia solani]|uniref:Deacetylase sirtuin-type domain-containing protein n=1 Tax=Rhizoctonia solani TaxID=456999 RepID=A0A8H3B815_9AGAM|nr:unnamed protein product [Rhizoctonia solani]